MTADDVTVLSVILDSPWERELRRASMEWGSRDLAAQVDKRALLYSAAAASALAQHVAVPELVRDEVSIAFLGLIHDRTVRMEAV